MIFLVAGEPSGDLLGARLIEALRRAAGDGVAIAGVGGDRMAAAGMASLFPVEDLAVMGFAEVLPRLPRILGRLRETAAEIARLRPAVVVTIDSPGFTLRLARRIRPLGLPLVHYVAPQLWAWKPERAKSLRGLFDRIMTILPFETAFFDRLGIATTYVGHPAIEAPPPAAGDILAELGLPGGQPAVAMLAGSRRGLVGRMLPIYRDVAARLAQSPTPPALVLPVVPGTAAMVRDATRDWPLALRVVDAPERKARALAACAAAVATSGTATLELALACVPMVVVYRTGWITTRLVRRWATVEHASLPNLIVGRGFLPELLGEACTGANIVAALAPLLGDPSAIAAQQAGFAEMRAQLGEGRPSDRAARVVLEAAAGRGAPP
ncbi:MAG: lipid-A-disaccharide synthase [Alphaproteobacteria bacterium]|nr:lipid-A-disaccharide synthase [Alphaproteobacteria bacterium]